MFGAGTAAIVCPISRIVYDGTEIDIMTQEQMDSLKAQNKEVCGPLTLQIHNELLAIQHGVIPSDWTVTI